MHFINAFVHQKSKYTVIYQQWFLPLRKLIKFYSDSLLHLCLWKFVSISEMGKWKLTKAMWFSQSHMVSRQRNHNLNLGALALKQSSLMRFAATWMDLEGVILKSVRPRRRNIIWHSLYVDSKKKWHKRTYKTERDSQTLKTNLWLNYGKENQSAW